MSAPDARYDIPADAFYLHGTDVAILLSKHVRVREPIPSPVTISDAPPMSLAFNSFVETREVCRECREPWEQWGRPTRKAVLLTGIYHREWKRQERIAKRALRWLAEVGSVAEWRDDPNRGALEFKMLVAKDAMVQFGDGYLYQVLRRACDAFSAAIKPKPRVASPTAVPQEGA